MNTDRAQLAALGEHLSEYEHAILRAAELRRTTAARLTEQADAWIQTFSGRAFYPLAPQPAHIDLIDVAHGLSQMCRYGGQCRVFYSVAEHSVLLSHAVPPSLARWALMHDSSEAFLCDVPRPIKPYLGGYYAIEARVMEAVALRFGLPWPMPAELKPYDDRILLNEQARLMAPPPMPWNVPGEPLAGVTPVGWLPMQAKVRFLDRAEELGIR
jgi:hypothetical protein